MTTTSTPSDARPAGDEHLPPLPRGDRNLNPPGMSLWALLREDFAIDEVFVGVHAPKLLRQDIEGLTRIDANGVIVRTWDDFFRTRLAECGPIPEARARLLFPKAATLPTSAAIVPLEKQHNLGMLALGAVDPLRFLPKQGHLFLDMTAELVAAALRARLG